MKINPKIFKSYDVRGIYPADLNEKIAFKIGQALIKKTRAQKVVVGRDIRLSSFNLSEALIKGILSQRADVYNIGLVPTEGVYFTTNYYSYDAGVMITASHNPKEYNGFKMVKKEKKWAKVIPGKDLKEFIKKEDGRLKKAGKIKELDIWPDYLNHILSFIEPKKIKPFKIVVDASNGMAAKVLPKLEPKLPVTIIPLNFDLNGNFPAHSPNPLLEESRRQISRAVLEKKADLGFIFDGDADRVYLIDESGNFIRADITLLLLARYFLEKNPGKGIAYNLICSKAVPEFIKKWNGNPIRTKVGFINVQKGMMENDGILGGELSGHYSFKDNFYLDSGFIAFLTLLQIISQSNKKVSELVKELSPYAKAPEINFEIKDRPASPAGGPVSPAGGAACRRAGKKYIIEKIKEKFSDGRQDYLDGLTVEYDDWWFNLRPSQTEPLLRLTIEAKNQKLLEQKKKELSSLILE